MSGMFLSDQISFRGPIPSDLSDPGIVGRTVSFYEPYEARDRESGQPLDNNELLRRILKNTDIDILLRTLGNAFFPRSITVGAAPTLLVAPNRYPRGYIFINPSTTVTSVVSTVTVFASQVFPVGVTNSASINVAGHGGAAFFLNVTEASAGPVTVDVQSQDPVTGNWANTQLDIFAGASALGIFYANIGSLGVDQNLRLAVNVAGDSMTASIGAVLKPALAGTVAGPTIFLGGPDVTTTIGYPLLGGQKEVLFLKENTPLFGIAAAATNLRLFELQ